MWDMVRIVNVNVCFRTLEWIVVCRIRLVLLPVMDLFVGQTQMLLISAKRPTHVFANANWAILVQTVKSVQLALWDPENHHVSTTEIHSGLLINVLVNVRMDISKRIAKLLQIANK